MQNASLYINFQKELKDSGLKLTYPRKRIFEVLSKVEKPLSVQEISAKLIDIHFVTIYRNIDTLVKYRIITKVPHGFKYRYELSDNYKPHQHHAICNVCKKSFLIRSQQIEYLLEEASMLAGVMPKSHHIEVHGVCKHCQIKLKSL